MNISSNQIERAKQEAQQRNLQEIEFSVFDMKNDFSHYQRTFDLMICCDESQRTTRK